MGEIENSYDVVLVDTHHLLDEMTLVALDSCHMSAFIITNDLVDLKNMKSLLSIYNEARKDNYKIVCATYKDGEIYLDDENVNEEIRSLEVTNNVSVVCKYKIS